MSQPGSLCVGIDVSKATLDIAANSDITQFTVSNDADGFDAIVVELSKRSVSLVLMEASGGLEAAVTCTLQAKGFDVTVINPRQARDFARAMGYLELMPECSPKWQRSLIVTPSGSALSGLCRMLSARFLLRW